MSELVERLKKELLDEDYRYAYDEEFSNSRIATQIKVLREQQELKQSELAELAGMKQSRISELENVNYNSWSISTLRRLARALGVRLSFAFESWGELLPEANNFGRHALERPRFEKDPVFKARDEAVVLGSPSQRNIIVQGIPNAGAFTMRVISGTASGVIQQTLPYGRPQLVTRTEGTSKGITQKEEGDAWQKTALRQ